MISMTKNKKGVSPLIATVLLVAFAVALATVIIQLEPMDRCPGVDVGFSEISGHKRIYLDEANKEIVFFIENNGKAISGFRIVAEGVRDVVNKDIKKAVGEKKNAKINFSYDPEKNGYPMKLVVTPQIEDKGTIKDCSPMDEVLEIKKGP